MVHGADVDEDDEVTNETISAKVEIRATNAGNKADRGETDTRAITGTAAAGVMINGANNAIPAATPEMRPAKRPSRVNRKLRL